MTVMDPGTEFGGYRIERLLGAGGFCNVYLAEDLRPALRRKVALKVLNPTLSADDKNRERFRRESLLAVELDDHPNIVGVIDAGEHDGQLFIAQRYIDGQDLGNLIETSGPLSADRAVEVMVEIAGALDYAHEAGLVHRDVKPRNILIRARDDRCFLADFGLTKRTASSDSLTGAGEFLGTFAYAAPEQLGGDPVDGRADLYALGCVLFESLTGSAPFSGDIHSMITSHLTKAPPRVSGTRADLPQAIDAVIDKAMAKEPGDRYQTGVDFAVAARKALLSSGLPPPVSTPPPPPPARVPPTPTPPPQPEPPAASGGRRSRVPLLVGGLVLLVVLVVGGALLFGGGDDGGDDEDDDRRQEEAREAEEEEEAQEEAEAAFELLPGSLGDNSCDLGDVDDYDAGVVAVFACSPAQGADDVELTVYDDADDADGAFADAQTVAAEELDPEGDCESDRYASHTWTTEEDSEGVAGQVACWLDDEEHAGLAWTNTEDQLAAVATREDGSDASLYRWWADLVGRGDPAQSEDFPNALETLLLGHVPTDLRESCVRADLRPNETASVQCTPESGAAVVFYNQYPTASTMNAQYETLLEDGGVARNTGADDECPFEGELTIEDENNGRVFCFLQDDGDAYMVWTNRPLMIQAEAGIAEGATVPQFWQWWTNAGPLV